MMIEPGITELSKCVDSRYTLVTMAAKRARMIGKEEHGEDYIAPVEKPVSVAAREIAEGKVGYVRSESIANVEASEEEIAEAVFVEDDGADEQVEETEEV